MSNFLTSQSASALHSGLAKFALIASVAVIAATSVKADSINKYHVVTDVIGNNDSDLYKATRTGFGSIQGVQSTGAAGDRTTIYSTLWDIPGSSFASNVYRGEGGQGSPGVALYSAGSASRTESDFSVSSAQLPPSSRVGIYSDSNPFSSDFNPYLRARNFRVIWSGVPYNSPTELSYANITDGGVYGGLPYAADLQTGVGNVGFRGFATPSNTQYPGISKVYLSLERLSDHLYWSGTQWSHLRINLLASIKPVTSNSAGRVEWAKVGGLPIGSNLLNGQYRLRTMAIEGVQFQPSGSGTLNTITFTINGNSSDTTLPNPSILTSPSPGSTVASLPTLSGTCSDNPGGSGVHHLGLNIVYEGSVPAGQPNSSTNPIHWNWITRTWQPYAASSNTAQNYLYIPINSGTTWTTAAQPAYAAYLPSGAQLYNGYYTIRLFTTDNAGNGETYSVFLNALRVTGGVARLTSNALLRQSPDANSIASQPFLPAPGAVTIPMTPSFNAVTTSRSGGSS